MKGHIIIALILIFNFLGNKQDNEIIKSNKIEFDKAYRSSDYIQTSDVKKTKNKITLKCKTLINDDSDENYKEFYFLGSIPNALNLKIIQQVNYNSNYYFIYDTCQNCKETILNGKPFLYNNYIIANNEDDTTDNINKITIWEIKNKKIIKNKVILLGDIAVYELRFKDKFIYIKTFKNTYYKLKIL